jgi:hypothetical protein
MIRRIKPEDIPVINGWFMERKFPDMSGLLPSYGFIMEDLCACFVYRDMEGRICWLAWTVTRPGLEMGKSVEVLKELVAHVEKEMTASGYPMMFATGKNGLGELFRDLGWVTGDLNINQYIKILKR